MGIANIMASKISAVEKAKRLGEMADKFKEVKMDLTAEEIEKAYEESNNLKEVDCVVHVSSCLVTLGKMGSMKNADLTEREREFIETCSNASKYQMFPVENRKLLSLETKAHILKGKYSLSGSNLMTKENFEKKFLPNIKAIEDEIQKVKDIIEDTFDDRYDIFSAKMRDIVEKIDPTKLDSVNTQLDFIKNRGAKGYIDRIYIEMRTGYDSDDIKKADLGNFLDQLKKSASNKFAGRVINSFFDDLWNGVITYLTNIGSPKYENSFSLEGFTSVKNKLRDCAITVRANAMPIETSVPDVINLAKLTEELSRENDKLDALDKGIETLIAISYIARENYAIIMRVPEKTVGNGIVPDWISQMEIDEAVDEMIKNAQS